MSQTFVSKITQKSEHGRNKIIPQSKFVKVFMKQKLKCYFLLTLENFLICFSKNLYRKKANFKVELNSITPCAFAKAAAVGWNNLLDHFYSSFLPDALRSSYVVSWVVQTRQDWALKSSEWTSWLDNQWKRSIPCTKKRSNTKMIDDVWNSRRQSWKES